LAELVWKGKGRGASRAPVQLRTGEVYGSPDADWHNRLILGDAHQALAALAARRAALAGKVALVYVDPPFDTGGSFDYRATIPGAADDAPRLETPAYSDARGLDAWLDWFYRTASLLRELLAPGGSIYVHLDAHAAHYAKVVLDEVFGADAFQREIVWRIGWVSGFKSRARGWIRNHDTLLFYAKGGRPSAFHKQYIPYPSGYVRRDGAPPTAAGYPVDDVWNGSEIDRLDSIQIMSFSGEKVGYPTQKNEALVARIIQASSSPGDLVLDCCVGSGTTAVVAEKLGRRWIACDSGPVAVHASRKRLLSMQTVTPFVVQGVGTMQPRSCRSSGRKLTVRKAVDGRRATLELASFALPAGAVPPAARVAVSHWSQWIEGWCVDWDHRGGPLVAGSRSWRTRSSQLALEGAFTYARGGRYAARVQVFDLLGGVTAQTVRIDVR
jgi:DNA modification methylase